MSVLDVFYILFKSQGTDDVKKSEDELKRSGDNLNQSMQESSSLSQKMGQSFNGLANQLTHTLTAAISLGAILHGIKSSISYVQDLDLASRMLAVNVEDLDAWDNAVQTVGGTAEQFQSSLKNLAQQLGTTGQIALEELPQLADSFQQMGRFASIKYGEIFGIDEYTILLLQRGRREVEAVIKRQKELGVVSKEDAEKTRELNLEWQNSSIILRGLFLEVGLDLLPLIIKSIREFGKVAAYFKQHSDLIVGGLIAIGVASVFAFPEFYVGIAAVTALAAAFGLLYEDIKFYLEGADSLIGRIEKKWPRIFKEIRLELEAWSKFFKIIDAFNNKINHLGDTFDKKRDSFFKGIFDGKNSNESASELIGKTKSENNGLSLSADDISRIKSSKLDHVKKVLDIVTTSSIGYMKPSDLQKYSIPSGTGNKSVTVNTGPITITTEATDGKEVGHTFIDYLNEQFAQTNNYFDDGVRI